MRNRMTAGLLAGAAGTTALNAVTYTDMALRGRPASGIPEQVVDRLGLPLRDANRRQAAAALLGIGVGAGVGAVYGLAGGTPAGALMPAATAALAGDGPPVALGLTDPRTWTAADWLSDVVPHLAYGLVTAVAYDGLTRRRRRGVR
ncbi:hypothetical protein [Actinomadura sp. DC4]|uniref:hypothetical protein n=1 Tax=Actinomadura sp. DC4 TaxID=3055069 RepID=UPI0025AFD5CD|nr:hypothetical protein [Actinomadura sp. DC4]MDN3354057.1 hypothetical protein [Actinomadura sp. DC4]